MDQLLKITYHLADKKMSAYLKLGSAQLLGVVKKDVELYLFEERQQPRCEIRLYWIDEDGDEIEIVSQKDYDIFFNKRKGSDIYVDITLDCKDCKHLHVAPVNNPTTVNTPKHQTEEMAGKSTPETQIPPADEMNDSRFHLNVECDSCLMAPIIGFRYKCIQCPNYDLCQNCESKHVHADHMMVRMPNNGCPYVVDAFITGGRKLSRKYEKRCKSGDSSRLPCGFTYASTSAASAATGNGDKSSKEGKANAEQSDATGKDRHHHGRRHRRHVRHNFLSHLYEMMHDLAEGGGATATAAAMGTADGCATTDTTTKSSEMGCNNDAKAKAAAAYVAAGNAHEIAAKAAEIAAKVAQQTSLSAAAAAAGGSEGTSANTEPTIEKTGPNTPHVPQSQTPVVPGISSQSLDHLAQFLNPQYMKTGIEILNNFSDMFAKMLDPIDGAEAGDSPSTSSCPFDPMTRKSSTASTLSTNSKKSNDSMKANDSMKSQNENQVTTDAEKNEGENEKNASNNNLVDIMDLGSDSESDGVSEGFVKLNVPTKENTPEKAADTVGAGISAALPTVSQGATPPQSLNKSNVMDFAQLSADLKAHIAQEQQKSVLTPEKENSTPTATASVVEMRAVPVFNTTPTSSVTVPIPPVYHANERINKSVHAMMSMGFANEGDKLTQLLASVDGNISEAIDIILATQR